MSRLFRYLIILILISGLILIRHFEDSLFYDPLLRFFKTDHSTQALPEMQTFKLVLNTCFRYFLNSSLSLLIIWFVFQNKGIIKAAGLLYMLLFIPFIIIFWILVSGDGSGSHMLLFYLRRFLIQPLFLLLLLPAFYFQKRQW